MLQNTEIVWLPPNSTSKTQPLNQGIICAFKAYYWKRWTYFTLEEYEAGRYDKLKQSMHIVRAIQYIVQAWDEVSAKTILNCWRQCGMAGPMLSQPGTSEASRPLAPLSLQQVVDSNTLGQLTSSFDTLQSTVLGVADDAPERMTIAYLLNPASEVVADSKDDLVADIVQQYASVPEEESDVEAALVSERVSASACLAMLERMRLHEVQATDCNPSWLKVLNGYEKRLRDRQFHGLQQKSIGTFFRPCAAVDATRSRQE